MNILECLFPLVGLSQIPCDIECYEDERIPCHFDEKDIFLSSSNYYVSQLVDLLPQLFASKKSNEGIFKMFLDCKLNASQSLEFDLRNSIMTEYDQRFSNWVGQLGETKKNQLVSTKDYSALVISPDQIKGGGLYITSFNFCTKDQKNDIELSIYSSHDMDNPIYVITGLTSGVNDACNPIYLPFDFDFDCDGTPSYFLVWNSDGCEVYKNRIDCGCSNFKTQYKKTFTVNGTTFNADEPTNCQNCNYGLSIQANFCCDPLGFICETEKVCDLQMKNVLAKALQYKVACELLNKILSSTNFNYFTLTSKESLFGKKKAYVKEYENIILWITENINVGKYSNCLKCKKSKRKIMKGKILV